MATQIPVICDTAECETLWFSTSIFGIGPGATIHSVGNKAGPCPKCHGMGHIPDGIYAHTSASLFDPRELESIKVALEQLRLHAAAGATPQQLQNEIAETYPFLAGLARYLPKNAAELAAYLAIFIALLTHYSQSSIEEETPTVHVEINITQALEQISADVKAK